MKRRIDSQRWDEICAVFDEIVELDAASRIERLSDIGAADPDLRRNVEHLLAADAEAATRLARIDDALMPAPEAAGMRDRDPLKLVGRTVSHFRIIETIGAGGMGVVYRAEDSNLRRTIALKFPLPSHHLERGVKERFLHEARSAGALDHPNICGIYEAGETADGQLFLAMPLYDGETLEARLAREGPLPIAQALAIARQIAAGLGAAHHAGIVHRDVKPANVMLLRDGTVKILDFGIAKVHDLALTASRARIGTVSYMAPEQIQGRAIDGRADLWALGVIMYEMLTGCKPFAGDYDVSVAHAVVHAEPARASRVRPGISAELDDVVRKLLSKDPTARYASATDLLPALADHDTVAVPRLRQPAGRRVFRRILKAPRTAALGLAVMAAVAVGAWLLQRSDARAPAAARTVAVIPFDDLGNQASHLALGVSDAIGIELSRLPSLIVPGYITTSRYESTSLPLSQIARELSAAAIVKGRVERAGDRVRFDMQLVDGRTSEVLWSERYDRPASEVLAIQQDAIRAIVAALDLDLSDVERQQLMRPPTTDARAYDLYLRGREAELRIWPAEATTAGEMEGIRTAQSFYSRAREVDPNFAIARARLALTHAYSAAYHAESPARLDQARLEAEAALRIRPDLPEAHEALAYHWGPGRREFAKATEHLKLAIQGFPNNAEYHQSLGDTYRQQGMWEEAVSEFERAMRLEPRNPSPAVSAAVTYSRLRRYEQAARAWDRAIALAPDDHMFRVIRGHVFLRWQGTVDTLAAAVQRIPSDLDPDGKSTWSRFQVARLQRRHADALAIANAGRQAVSFDDMFYHPRTLLRAQAYEALGDTARARADYDAARRLLIDSLVIRPRDPRMRIALAMAYAGLGQKPQAIEEARATMALVPVAQNSTRGTAAMAGAVEVYLKVGERSAALELLELLLTMPAGREVSVPLLRVDPAYDPLRGDPRFERLLERFSTSR